MTPELIAITEKAAQAPGSRPFDEYLIEIGARALCLKNERHHSPDDLQLIFPAGWDMRKKTLDGDPYWMKYRDDAKTVIDAIFDRSNRVRAGERVAVPDLSATGDNLEKQALSGGTNRNY